MAAFSLFLEIATVTVMQEEEEEEEQRRTQQFWIHPLIAKGMKVVRHCIIANVKHAVILFDAPPLQDVSLSGAEGLWNFSSNSSTLISSVTLDTGETVFGMYSSVDGPSPGSSAHDAWESQLFPVL